MRFSKKFEREEKQNTDLDIAQLEVYGPHGQMEEAVENEKQLDLALVKKGRKEDMDYMIEMLKMFKFGSWREAATRAGQNPTTTTWVDRGREG